MYDQSRTVDVSVTLSLLTWAGTDAQGQAVGSGVYFYRLTVGDEVTARKMLMLK